MLEQATQVTPLPNYLRLTRQPLLSLRLSRPLVYWRTKKTRTEWEGPPGARLVPLGLVEPKVRRCVYAIPAGALSMTERIFLSPASTAIAPSGSAGEERRREGQSVRAQGEEGTGMRDRESDGRVEGAVEG